ncbi:hypothetical protein BDV97DRAFT_402208 [Delphinella strobiligena]|nr:hypothetical protein BDV97DRAFT_402208 [Delphinella strobiligena]
MSSFYYKLQRLSIDYYGIAGTSETELLGHAELKNKERVSPELRSMWASLLGKKAGLPLDKDSADPLHDSGLRNFEILTGLLAVYFTNVVFLGEEDVFKWPHPTKLAERHLKDAMGKVHATIDASLGSGEVLEESVKRASHIDKLGGICASQPIDSLQSRRSQEGGITGIVRDIFTHIMKLLEPHIPFLYIDHPKDRVRPKTTPYEEWRRDLEGLVRQALDLSQELDIRQWPYYLSWFPRGEVYDTRFMQTSADLADDKKWAVRCSYGPAISVYHDITGHRVIHKAFVRVVRLPEDE